MTTHAIHSNTAITRWFKQTFTGFNREIWKISLAAAILSGALLGMLRLLKTLYLLRLGYEMDVIGITYAIGALAYALTSVPAGALGSRIGTRRTMIIGAAMILAGMAGFCLIESVPTNIQVLWIYAVHVVTFSGWCVFEVNMLPTLMHFTSAENSKRAFAMKEACSGFGQFIGIFVGGLLPGLFAHLGNMTTDSPGPYHYAIIVSVFLAAIGFIATLMIKAGATHTQTQQTRGQRPAILPIVLLLSYAFFCNGAMAASETLTSAYLDQEFGLSTSLIGTLSSIGMILAIAAALFGPRLAVKRGSGNTMRFAALFMVIALLQTALIPHWISAALGYAVVLALASMWRPAYQVMQMELAGSEWRSLIAGIAAFAISAGYGAVSFGGGYLVVSSGYRWVFGLGAVLALVSAGLSALLMRNQQHTSTIVMPASETEAIPCASSPD